MDETSQKNKETLNAGIVFSSLVGQLILICIIRQLFAQCLAERISKHMDFYYNLPESAFPMDEYLKTLSKSECVAAIESAIYFNASRQTVYIRAHSLKIVGMSPMNHLIIRCFVPHVGILQCYSQ